MSSCKQNTSLYETLRHIYDHLSLFLLRSVSRRLKEVAVDFIGKLTDCHLTVSGADEDACCPLGCDVQVMPCLSFWTMSA